ncbi:hypothetical protein AB4114_07335 [Paenibacillus sp. 2RAB27]|uniref:hypothetical protein n=1 Tax=Paenibacillus sp. 2RAB27 TaxID=3232991 RepID=UPI003F989CBA
MADKGKNDNENDFYEGMAEKADFIHDRLGVEGPIGFNNTVEEYMNDDEEKR